MTVRWMSGECQVNVRWMSGECQFKISLLRLVEGLVVYRSRSGEVQVRVRRASNLQSFQSLTLVDVFILFSILFKTFIKKIFQTFSQSRFSFLELLDVKTFISPLRLIIGNTPSIWVPFSMGQSRRLSWSPRQWSRTWLTWAWVSMSRVTASTGKCWTVHKPQTTLLRLVSSSLSSILIPRTTFLWLLQNRLSSTLNLQTKGKIT